MMTSIHSLPADLPVVNSGFTLSSSFLEKPESVCGNVKAVSDTIPNRTRVPRRKCFCGIASIVNRNAEGRVYITCLANRCKFFRWGDTVLDPPFYHLAHSKVDWKPLEQPIFKILPKDMSQLSEHVVQGSLGDCWFLSALTVVCEDSERISRVVSRDSQSDVSFRFCRDGLWTEVTVDKSVPFFKDGKKKGREAFAQSKDNVSFCPLIEKAYAKMYGSYASLHGGQIAEALFDLTGCPTDTIDLDDESLDLDLLWASLCSWKESDFLVGCATSHSIPLDEADVDPDSKGLVTMHAYSVTDVVELHDVPVGRQTKMTDFLNSQNAQLDSRVETLRLVQVRNPWGRREWTGDWSGTSDKWTRTVKSQMPSYNERNQRGRFWMDLNDFVHRFSEIEIAKTHNDWFAIAHPIENISDVLYSLGDLLDLQSNRKIGKVTISSNESSSIWCYISLVHPSIRGNDKSFYPDVHMLLINTKSGEMENACIGQTDRVVTIEVLLKGGVSYELVLFTVLPRIEAPSGWRPVLRIYSATPLSLMINSPESVSKIPSSIFEAQLAKSLPVVQQIQIGDALTVSVHASHCLAAFIVSHENTEMVGEVKIALTLGHPNLRAIGRWKHRISQNRGKSVVGIVTQIKTRYFSRQLALDGFTFDIDLVPEEPTVQSPPRSKRRIGTVTGTVEVIELE